MYMPSSGSIRLTTNISTAGTKWNFRKYTGSDINGVEWMSFNSSFIAGETFAYSAYMYSSVIGRNGPVEYSVSDDTVASIDKYTGYFTATKPGVIKVRVTYPGAPWYWYRSVTVSDTLFVECFEEKGFWDVSNGATAQTIECNDKSQSSRGIWVFEYKNNGYYAIKNDITGRYVTESSGTVKHLTGSGSTTTQQWRLYKQSDGTYKIESRSKPGYYIIESNAIHVPVDPDIQLSNSSSVGNRNKWHLKSLIMKLDVYYDQELINLCAAQNPVISVDQFFNDVFYTKPSGVANYRTLPEAFLQDYGIHVKLNIIQGAFESYPYVNDNCLYRNDRSTPCNNCRNSFAVFEIEECFAGFHHKSADRFLSSPPKKSNSISMMYTGHKATCNINFLSHEDATGTLGYAECPGSQLAMMMNTFTTPGSNYFNVKSVNAHELLHTFGVDHHYGNGINCIMGANRFDANSVVYPLTTCSSCKSVVNSNKHKLYEHN